MSTSQHAIYAARSRYCERHAIPISLYRLACQLEAAQSMQTQPLPMYLKQQAY